MVDRRELLNTVGLGLGLGIAAAAAPRLANATDAAATDAGSNAPGNHVSVLGGQIHYQETGQGETLVLLHKLGGRSQEWRRMMPGLGSRYRVIALDFAGHGQSRMHGPPPYIATQEVIAAQVMAALDEIGAGPPYRFMGSSAGGCVSVVCAALWPGLVAGVVSVGAALGGVQSREDMYKAAAEWVERGMFDADDNPLPREISYAQNVFGVEDEAIAREQNESRAEAGQWIPSVTRGVGRFDFLGTLPRVSAPVLLAWGERGSYGNFVEPALELLPAGQKASISNSGAFPHEEAPAETLELVTSFFE